MNFAISSMPAVMYVYLFKHRSEIELVKNKISMSILRLLHT